MDRNSNVIPEQTLNAFQKNFLAKSHSTCYILPNINPALGSSLPSQNTLNDAVKTTSAGEKCGISEKC